MICKQCQTNPVSRRDKTATKTGLCDVCLERPFPITSVCRLDLLNKFKPKDVGRFDDGDMSYLAERMAQAYTDTVFWIDLEVVAGDVLKNK